MAPGLDLPDADRDGYEDADCGSMKRHHRTGWLLFLPRHAAQMGDTVMAGRLGADLTVAQGYASARQCGAHVPGGSRQAVGSLDRVVGTVRTLDFVVCTPEFTEVRKVSSGMSELLLEVFGPERGLGGRATIGVTALANGVCFETWATIEVGD
jgi:hypothetical protein